jgi:2-polyprenyl-6-methoxyphenol hydroxylase-like FAD-dependent oxidoreductase
LWPNAIKVLRALKVGDAVIAAGRRIDRGQLRHTDGSFLVDSDQQWLEAEAGAPLIAVHRADLQAILAAALPAGVVHLNKRVSGFDQNTPVVKARFADGSAAEGDVLIGADGLHSAVRTSLRPDVRPRYAGYVAWRGVADDTALDPAKLRIDATSETWGPGARFGIVPIGARRIYWFATANRARGLRRTPAERRAELIERFATWHRPIQDLIERTPADGILENDVEDLRPFRGWSRGRVALLGDSAHATTPNLGQGACMAIESAAALADALAGNGSIASKLEAYERARYSRTAWITKQSLMVGQVGQWSNPLLCALRRTLLPLSPERSRQAFMRRAVGVA